MTPVEISKGSGMGPVAVLGNDGVERVAVDTYNGKGDQFGI